MIKGILFIWALLRVFFFLPPDVPVYAQDQEASRIRIAAIPNNPRPGEPVTIGLAGAEAAHFQAVLIDARGRRLAKASFFTLAADKEGRAVQAAILPVPCTAKPGTALIQVENGDGRIGEILLAISNREFVSEEIVLDQRNTDLRTVADPQKAAESNLLWGIISRTGTVVYAEDAFIPPVQSARRTSFFGDRRVFKYADGSSAFSIHAGIDYGVPLGTEVRACAAGKVVLARSRIVTGNSVIIEHLPGVYSLYYHLDRIQVKEGTVVNAGTVLGQSGATGLATGPHLHWEIRVAGENTDPDALVSRPILDKEAILSIFNSF
ncbi:MAG: M23 family metallopeptidase [Treponema sp.]|jgi:murein DD-endopeptidase MepM/ murein hydrolase activator NlpD|nr:M23 family metallopeptidase [Treponema sp.]